MRSYASTELRGNQTQDSNIHQPSKARLYFALHCMCTHPPLLPLIVSLFHGKRADQSSRSIRRREDNIIDQLHCTSIQRTSTLSFYGERITIFSASHRIASMSSLPAVSVDISDAAILPSLSQRIVETERSLRTRDFQPRRHKRGGRGVPNDPDRPESRILHTHPPPRTCPLLRVHSW